MSLTLWKFEYVYNYRVWLSGKLWQAFSIGGDLRAMANNTSNGEHQTTTKQPPLPSPLRFSKFFQVKIFLLFYFFFIWVYANLMFTAIGYYGMPYGDCFYYVIVIFLHLGSWLCLLAFISYNLFVVKYIFFLTFNYRTCYAAFALSNISLIGF